MLPLGTKPVIQHVVEELARAGIGQILVVTGRKKRAIEDHFDADAPWRDYVNKRVVDAEVWRHSVQIFYTRQSEPRGLGDAVAKARGFCENQPFVVALGDAVIISSGQQPPLLQRLIQTFEQKDASACIATYRVDPPDTARYGVLAPAERDISPDQPFPIADIVEKPGPDKAPSNWVVSARYVFGQEIFDALEECRKSLPEGEELQLTDAIRHLVRQGCPVYAVPLATTEFRLDVGDFSSYGRAFVRMLSMHPDHGEEFLRYLRRFVAFVEDRGPDPDAWAAE